MSDHSELKRTARPGADDAPERVPVHPTGTLRHELLENRPSVAGGLRYAQLLSARPSGRAAEAVAQLSQSAEKWKAAEAARRAGQSEEDSGDGTTSGEEELEAQEAPASASASHSFAAAASSARAKLAEKRKAKAAEKLRKETERAAKHKGAPGETPADKQKDSVVDSFRPLFPHMAGEGGGTKPLSGGHILLEMKAKYSDLRLVGVPNAGAAWHGHWSDGIAKAKWSSFFPASWRLANLEGELRESTATVGDSTRYLKPSDIPIAQIKGKGTGTLYPLGFTWEDSSKHVASAMPKAP